VNAPASVQSQDAQKGKTSAPGCRSSRRDRITARQTLLEKFNRLAVHVRPHRIRRPQIAADAMPARPALDSSIGVSVGDRGCLMLQSA